MIFISACKKNDPTERVQTEDTKAISDYLNGIGFLDSVSITEDIPSHKVSETSGAPVSLSVAYTDKPDWYIPVTVESRKSGTRPKANNLAMQSMDVIWPGNLIQGNSVRNNQLSAVPLAEFRKPGAIYLSVVSGEQGMKYYRNIPNFTGYQVTQAMNDILAPYSGGFPANSSYSQQTVHSKEEMAFYLDMTLDEFDQQTKGTFQSVNWAQTNKTWTMIKLEQIFFTMVYEYPGIDSLFNAKMDAARLKPYIYEKNPLCYISSVSYGRYFVLLYEMDNRYQSISGALGKLYDAESTETLTLPEKNAFTSSAVWMMQVGGDAEAGFEVLSGKNPNALHDFVVNGARFSKDNVGAPIYYTICYAVNNRAVETYKELDVTFKDTEYRKAAKDNAVEITLNSIFSAKLKLTGGNRNLNDESYITVSDIVFSVSDGAGWKRIKTVPSGIYQAKTKDYATSKSYYQTISTGALGENTTQRIKMSFSVTYNNVRKSTSIWGDTYDRENRTYEKEVVFSFNTKNERWEASYNPAKYTEIRHNSDFRYIGFTDGFNFCENDFYLYYSFKANYVTY